MVTIRYRLTPEDLAELEEERRGGIGRRAFRITAGVFMGLVGVLNLRAALYIFPFNRWPLNLIHAGAGLLFLWAGFEFPGLSWLLRQFHNPHGECEIQIDEGKIVCSSKKRTRQFRWLPQRGFKESDKFFTLRASDNVRWRVPKRAVSVEQAHALRQLVEEMPTGTDIIECRFFLTQADLDEASAATQPWPWLATKNGRIVGRCICALFALVIPLIPRYVGKSWPEMLRSEPAVAWCLIGFELFYLWAIAGCAGLKRLNRLDLERRMRISGLNIQVCRGDKISTYPWKRFSTYQETENLFILRAQVRVRCRLISKRALAPPDQERLRSLLNRKLPKEI